MSAGDAIEDWVSCVIGRGACDDRCDPDALSAERLGHTVRHPRDLVRVVWVGERDHPDMQYVLVSWQRNPRESLQAVL